ncbi:MAG: hypothetical protein SV760_10250, partial [Halobacteria archaeon]|nr:hypothetical protein [Halobacteria archaeon]
SGRRGGGVSRIADARAESGFSSRLRWSFVSGGREVAADVGFTTQNSSVYLDELRDRGFPMPDETSFEATVEAHEGDLDAQIELGTESQGIPTLRQLRPSESFWLLFAPLPFHSLLERRGEY